MKIDYTPDPTARSYKVGGALAVALQAGVVVTILAAAVKLTGAFTALGVSVPWLGVLLPTLIPLTLSVALFVLLGVVVAVAVAKGAHNK